MVTLYCPRCEASRLCDDKVPGIMRCQRCETIAAIPVNPTLFGGHAFTDDPNIKDVKTCIYLCGCWMGAIRSGGPVDPFGPCPKNPKSLDEMEPVLEPLKPALELLVPAFHTTMCGQYAPNSIRVKKFRTICELERYHGGMCRAHVAGIIIIWPPGQR